MCAFAGLCHYAALMRDVRLHPPMAALLLLSSSYASRLATTTDLRRLAVGLQRRTGARSVQSNSRTPKGAHTAASRGLEEHQTRQRPQTWIRAVSTSIQRRHPDSVAIYITCTLYHTQNHTLDTATFPALYTRRPAVPLNAPRASPEASAPVQHKGGPRGGFLQRVAIALLSLTGVCVSWSA